MAQITVPAEITSELVAEARDWASDCLGMPGDRKVSKQMARVYVARAYPGGWSAFAADAECAWANKKGA